jgi:Tfp pilus assembly protein PilE
VKRGVILQRKGFKSTELLAGIVVIAAIAALATVAISDVQAKSRDSVRKRDLLAMKSALGLYYADQKPEAYPLNSEEERVDGNTDALSIALLNGYLEKIPVDPKNATPHVYTYESLNSAQDYRLTATLENKKDPDGKNGDDGGYVITPN